MRHVLFLILVLSCLPSPAQSQSGPAVTLPPAMSFPGRNAVVTVTMRSATPSPVVSAVPGVNAVVTADLYDDLGRRYMPPLGTGSPSDVDVYYFYDGYSFLSLFGLTTALFTYSGEGEKLRAQYTVTDMSLYGGGSAPPQAALVTTRLDYRGGRVYVDGSLAYAPVPGGYCTVIADTLAAHLTVRDYRGDVRSVIAEDGSVEEWADYYPYGMAFYNPSASVQPWKHSGKEHESRLGLHWLYFGARRLDFAKGQWTTVDPLADKSPWQSPYAYCGADPVNYIDPDGKIKIIAIKNDNR